MLLSNFGSSLFKTWKDSHLDTRFYRQMHRYSWINIAIYLLLFYIILGTLYTLFFAVKILPQWEKDWKQTHSLITEQWPANVQINYQDNQIFLQDTEPDNATSPAALTLPLPKPVAKNYQLPKNLAYIDTSLQESSASTIPALLIFGQDRWWLKRFDNLSSSYRYDEMHTGSHRFTFDQQWWQDNTNWDKIRSTFLPSVLIGSWLWFGAARLVVRVLVLLPMVWLAQPLLWFLGQPLRYQAAFRRGLFILPLAEEVLLLSHLLYSSQNIFSFWLVWLLAFVVISWNNRARSVRQV